MLLSSLNTFEKNTEIKIHSEPLNFRSSLNTTQSPFKVEYIEKSKFNPLKNNKPLISYIININVSNSNTIISINDKNGKLKGYLTSGILGFKGSQKTKKYTLISILKNFNYKFNFLNNKSVLINFKGITKDQKLFIKKLKEKVSIKAIIYTNLLPHNGCRPKKMKKG